MYTQCRELVVWGFVTFYLCVSSKDCSLDTTGWNRHWAIKLLRLITTGDLETTSCVAFSPTVERHRCLVQKVNVIILPALVIVVGSTERFAVVVGSGNVSSMQIHEYRP